MILSVSPGVGSSGAQDAGDMARARKACKISKHLIVAAANRAASGGEAGFVAICAEISSKARSDEKRLVFVHCDDLGGSGSVVVSLAVAVEGSSSARSLLDSIFRGGCFVCFPFPLFEADGVGFVMPTSSGVAVTRTRARVASSSVSSSIARVRHAAHSSDTGLVAERQK
jgi:hypothetical protein